MWSWRILVFILLASATRTWGDCVNHGEYIDYEYYRAIGHGMRYYYHCSNMTRNQYKSDMDEKIDYWPVGRLELNQINLSVIDQQLFAHSNYGNVVNLKIQECNVTTIENHSFDKFTNLYLLYITENNMKHFNGDFIEPLKKLYTLDLSDNNIQQFNINCRHNNFKLDLSNNSIEQFNKSSFKNCEGLQKLFIQNSVDFDKVESGMFDIFKNLSTLNLTNTGINNIYANGFKGLISLLSLDLHFNKISSLPCNIFEPQNQLKALNLSNNLIENISICSFQELLTLESLDLHLNKISSLPCNIFEHHNQLKALNLSNNLIENISICDFQNLLSLEFLNLQFNKISFLKDRTFSALGQLRYLDISHNKLSALSESLLHPLDRIVVLDISANHFTHLNPEQLFSHLTTLRNIDLSGNQWASCQNLTLIRKYLRSRGISFESKIKNFNDDNVGGIQCTQDKITTNNTDNIIHGNKSSNSNEDSVLKSTLNTLKKLITVLENSQYNSNATLVNINKLSELVFENSHAIKNLSLICLNYLHKDNDKNNKQHDITMKLN